MLSKEQAYLAMFFMLDQHYWTSTKNDSLGQLLGSLNPYLFIGSKTADPAAWEDWIDSITRITDASLLSPDEALKACMVFLEFYMSEFGFDVGWILEDIRNMSDNDKVWLFYVNHATDILTLN